MPQPQDGCVKPTKGPIAPSGQPPQGSNSSPQPTEVKAMTARIGQEAPDFEVSAYIDGGFKNIQLSTYRGKWVVLCFYPGDFTFV